MPKKYKYKKSLTYHGHRYRIYGDTLEEIGRKKQIKLEELKKTTIKEKNILVADYVPECIARYKTGQAESTRKDFSRLANKNIIAHMGEYKLADVTPELCQDVLNLQAGKSKSQINKVYNALRFIFSHAHSEGKTLNNPTQQLKKPKGTYTPRRALTPLEREIIINIAKTDRRYYAFLLMLFCGCRPAEAFECKGADISIIDKTPALHIKGTKTKSADRFVPIPDELYSIIKNIKKNDYISVSSNGKPYLDKNNRTKLWRGLWYKMNIDAGTRTHRNKLQEPLQIPKELTPYCLRHEYCSELARRGVDIRDAQIFMGHANIQMTANIYTHIDNKNIISNNAKILNRQNT